MWLPNRTAVLLSWDKHATVGRMVDNFKTDLGQVKSELAVLACDQLSLVCRKLVRPSPRSAAAQAF